jgi:putative protein-disulfide isomerase
MESKKLDFIYVYDALCGWCYGFSPVVKEIYTQRQDIFNFEVLSGGMILGDREGAIGEVAPYIKQAYKTVEDTCGVKFGEQFLTILDEGTQYFSSEKPAIALSVFKSYLPEQAVLFAHTLQSAIYDLGLDLNQLETYSALADQYQLPATAFIAKMESEEFKQAAYYDFALARQLQVSGYPAAFIKTGENKFHMIAKGYTDLETMQLRIDNVLKEINYLF